MIGHLATLPNWVGPAQQSQLKAPYPTVSISIAESIAPEPPELICAFVFLKITIHAIVHGRAVPGKRHGRAAKTALRVEGPYSEAEVRIAPKRIADGELRI
jgi:hypothetical protein